jgi:hypothetical protein
LSPGRQRRSPIEKLGGLRRLQYHRSPVGTASSKGHRVLQKTARFRTASKAAELVHGCLASPLCIRVEVLKRLAPLSEKMLVQICGSRVHEIFAQYSQHPLFMRIDSSKSAAARNIGCDGCIPARQATRTVTHRDLHCFSPTAELAALYHAVRERPMRSSTSRTRFECRSSRQVRMKRST